MRLVDKQLQRLKKGGQLIELMAAIIVASHVIQAKNKIVLDMMLF